MEHNFAHRILASSQIVAEFADADLAQGSKVLTRIFGAGKPDGALKPMKAWKFNKKFGDADIEVRLIGNEEGEIFLRCGIRKDGKELISINGFSRGNSGPKWKGTLSELASNLKEKLPKLKQADPEIASRASVVIQQIIRG